ncbi:hypothetical protein ElyMa_000363100 [Elysia marginata]|uniref:ABC transmembrane type-1 domain-containing protein n=1 Tax=Elysia marginata TaxID=1093978 RepID=A0AAV4FHK8_9GAST|nr:hypothetical protein ElyMa_000363100 [Elysia marginata]
MKTSRVGATIRAFNFGTEAVAMKLMLAVILVVVWASGDSFSASSTYVVFGLCQVLRTTAFFFLSFSIEKAVQLRASLFRVQENAFCVIFIIWGLELACYRFEISFVRRWKLVEGIGKGLEEVMIRLALLAVLIGAGSGNGTSAASIFSSLAWLLALHSVLMRFPTQAILSLRTFYGAAAVVQKFLLLDEEKETIKDLRLHRSIQRHNDPHADWAVDIDHMTARWPLVYTEGRRRFQKKRLRSSTSSTKSLLREGELIAVVGVVGSGKVRLYDQFI